MMFSRLHSSSRSSTRFALGALLVAAGFALPAAAQTTPPASAPPAETLPSAPAPAAPQSPPPDQLPDSPGAARAPRPTVEPTGPSVVIDTSMGRLTCRLYEKEAPLASANFIGLANGTKEWADPITGQKVNGKPYYNGTTFHRVIPSFMIQGGDRKGDGSGDAGYFFDNEVSPNLTFDTAGRLAMANAGPNTNGTQFFITEVPYPDLDGKYTIFGQCDAHTVLMVATIARVDRNSDDKPRVPVTIDKVSIVPVGKPLPPDPAAPAATAPANPPTP